MWSLGAAEQQLWHLLGVCRVGARAASSQEPELLPRSLGAGLRLLPLPQSGGAMEDDVRVPQCRALG